MTGSGGSRQDYLDWLSSWKPLELSKVFLLREVLK